MKLSRRNFIKGAATVGAGLGLTGGAKSGLKWFQEARAAAETGEEKVAFTYHPPNCGGRCSFKCTVRDGKLVKIEPNDWTDPQFKKICLRGISEIERVYSPDRIKQPMRRVGERGEGKFEPITWDEALTTIAEKLHEIKNQYGGEAIVFRASAGVEHSFSSSAITSLLGAQAGHPDGIDIGLADGLNMVTGERGYAGIQNELTDWVNSNMVLLLGCNLLETTITDAAFFFNAKENGAKIVAVDPSYSTTAAKANQWISIRPGTDAALLLGMAALILEKGWYQEEYLKNYTTAPFLVRLDNGELLRQSDLVAGGAQDKFMVYDAAGGARVAGEAGQPLLEGTFTVNGVEVKTIFTLLKENFKQYTPAWAAQMTEIPENTIVELTREYALGGPAVIAWGWAGTDKWYHSDTTGRVGGILASLTGNIGRVGGSVGGATHHMAAWGARLGGWPLPEEFKPSPGGPVTDWPFKPNPVRAFISQGNYLLQRFADLNQTIEWVKGLELVVVIDFLHNPSVDFADIVLPAAESTFENEYELGNLQINRSHVLLQSKVIDPLFESKTDFQIEKELCAKLGLDQYLPPSPQELLEAKLSSADPALDGITLNSLLEHHNVMRLKAPMEPYRGYMDHKFGTASGRLELYHEALIPENMPLPVYEEPQEASPQNPLYQKYPLMYNQAHSRFRAHSQFSNAQWLLQLNPEPVLEMNPRDAAARGLKDGDLAEVYNDRGRFVVRYQAAEDIRPGLVRVSEGWWSRYFKEGSFQSVTNAANNPRQYKMSMGPVIPFNDTLVEVRKAQGGEA